MLGHEGPVGWWVSPPHLVIPSSALESELERDCRWMCRRTHPPHSPLTTCDHQSKRPEIRETGTPLGVSNKVGDLSPLVYIRKRACGAFFGMHALSRFTACCDAVVSSEGRRGACLRTLAHARPSAVWPMSGHALLPRPPRRRASRFSPHPPRALPVASLGHETAAGPGSGQRSGVGSEM